MKKHVLFRHQAVTLKASPVPTAHELHLSEYFSLYKNKKSTRGTKKDRRTKSNLNSKLIWVIPYSFHQEPKKVKVIWRLICRLSNTF